ncbi:MAG: DUF3422 domain-containing protein [Pseudomonadota bacterium]
MIETLRLPANHVDRQVLNDEVHARPPMELTAPCRLSYLALASEGVSRRAQQAPILAFARFYGIDPPAEEANHYAVDVGGFRLKWERHTEFCRYTVAAPGIEGSPFETPALALLPKDWLASLPGRTVVASHAAMLGPGQLGDDYDVISDRYFRGEMLIGAKIAGGQGVALTDLRIRSDGFSRFLIENDAMTTWQAGRLMQRLFEIDTYRMMALLTLPVARRLTPTLSASEEELAEITSAMAAAGEADEPALLDRLTRLEAAIETTHSTSHYRFTAANAYHALVQRRIEELREERIEGLQTFKEFTERRLAPAMDTCRAVAARQAALSERVARAVSLLSTRVDVARQRQNHEVLAAMNKRAAVQLRLQETVEGLSIAAVTYYIVGLISYASKGLTSFGISVNPTLVVALSIPVVLVLVALGLSNVRRMIPFLRRDDE